MGVSVCLCLCLRLCPMFVFSPVVHVLCVSVYQCLLILSVNLILLVRCNKAYNEEMLDNMSADEKGELN